MEAKGLLRVFAGLTTFVLLIFLGSLTGFIWTRTARSRTRTSAAAKMSPARTVEYYKLLREQILSESGFDRYLSISLDDPRSYEWKALQWTFVNAAGESKGAVDAAKVPHVLQRFAMATTFLSFALDVAPDKHECDWEGIQCNDQQQVISMNSQGQKLVGTIPGIMTFLSNLEVIDFTDQGLKGRLPSPHRWTNLRELRLSGNLLTSVFTSVIMDHSWPVAIESIDLSGNDLEETIGTASLFAPWTKLRYVDLRGNKRLSSATLLDNLHWSSLQHLNIAETNITGALPDTTSVDYAQLQVLAVGPAPLTGPLPERLATATNLRILSLGTTVSSALKLAGTLPETYGRLTQLEQLSIVRTAITSTLPTSWGISLTKLRALDLYENPSIQGSIPESWKGLTSLEIVRLVDMGLSGTVPSSLSQWTNLQSLSIHRNALSGTVPEEICGLPLLTTMSADCGGNDPDLDCDCCTFCFSS